MSTITDLPLFDRSLLTLDGDEHVRVRRLVAQAFTPRAVARLRVVMRETMASLLDPIGDASYDSSPPSSLRSPCSSDRIGVELGTPGTRLSVLSS